ncbi:MAG: hypothetical protein KZQ78_12835 [Candidatus Thiodiazotropha sp. (ex Ustalcina ferruginea)]|nr:hypothetical protein [Candidatus Thiodiazotropha sp. (ex Ustalcina ferruginea)]
MRTSITSNPIHRQPLASPRPGLFCLAFVLLLLSGGNAFGNGGFQLGAVYAKSLILSEAGIPIYVEYGLDGEIFTEIGEASGTYAEARVMAAEVYRAYQVQLQAVRTTFPDLDLVSREVYQNAQYTTVNDEPIEKPPLTSNTVMVALRPLAQRLLSDPSQLILMELPINPQLQIGDNSQSVLLDKDGTLLWDSGLNIGFKTGFVSDPEGNEQITNDRLFPTRDHEDTIHGPLKWVVLENGLAHRTITGNDGTYSFHYPLPPCPGFFYDFTMPIVLQLYYQRFNPRRGARYPYFMRRLGFDYCVGYSQVPLGFTLGAQMAQVNALAIVATLATPPKRKLDFVVDMIVMAGQARMPGTVAFATETRYNGESAPLERIAQEEYDFDGDGDPDRALLGQLVSEPDPVSGEPVERFQTLTPADNPDLQGVWLSSRHDLTTLNPAETLPDLTRLADWSSDYADRGLLTQISEEDLRNTDLYVFRASAGTLVTERHGLKPSELSKNFVGVDEEKGTFYYTVRIMGAREGRLNPHGYTSRTRGGSNAFQQWQADGQMNPAFYEREADHLRPGEQVQLIAINRATGYIGTLTTALKQAGSSLNPHEISFPIDDLMMGPPNLKVWAERTSQVEHGLTRGDEPEQAIGHEGAGLSDDTLITVYTEWFDRDGRPLPEGLDEHGYTGRLAKVIAPNQLAAVGGSSESGNSLSNFEIKTGRQTQVIRLPEPILGKQHLYVQVSGEPSSRNPDFGSSGLHQDKLQYRPDRYVPLKVPVYDEHSSLLQLQAYRQAKQAFDEGTITIEPKKPEPLYRYTYRPEFQFSVFDLAMREVRRTDIQAEAENLLTLDKPVIASTDQLIELLYDLTASDADPLGAYSYEGDRELVFALGEEEIRATLGENQQLSFDSDSLEHLAALDLTPEDYLMIRLYSNNDAGNILWEYAFEYLSIYQVADNDFNESGDVFYLNADELELDLEAMLLGFASRDEELKTPQVVRWITDGDGSMTPAAVTDAVNGIFRSKLTMPTQAGATVVVKAELNNESENRAEFKKIVMLPGKPANISVSYSGQAYVQGQGDLVATATITDAYGNAVLDGTTVGFAVTGDSVLGQYQSYTEDGQVTVEIKGGFYSGLTNQLFVQADEVEQSSSFNVSPLNVVVDAGTGSLSTNQLVPVNLTVSSAQGPAENVFVELSASHGRLQQTSFNTDIDGKLTVLWHTGTVDGTANFMARVDRSVEQAQSIELTHAVTKQGDIASNVVIGDSASAGTASFTDFSGANVALDYQTNTAVNVSGSANQSVNISLDNHLYPNREPLVALPLQRIYGNTSNELSTLHNAVVTNAVLSADHPVGVGQSVQLNGDGDIRLPMSSALQTNTGGIRFFLKASSASGTVLNIGEGHRLAINGGVLQYTVATSDSDFTVSSPITLNQWVSVVARTDAGVLSLSLDEGVQVKRL